MSTRIRRDLSLFLLAVVLVALAVIVAFQLHAFDRLAIGRVKTLAQDKSKEWQNRWFGIPIQQYPSDLVTYENLIERVRPDVIVETGTLAGGGTLYLSMLLEFIKPTARIITVDIAAGPWRKTIAQRRPELERLFRRITFVEGGSTEPATLQRVKSELRPGERVLVLLDTLHTKDHVLTEMNLYAPMVTVGSYLVVTDTQLDGNKANGYQEGPMAALQAFLPSHPEFRTATEWNRYFLTACALGFLERIGP